eukprot:CAMPEP_0116561050 /NCGR_PEP_ID=MMETSP0397-20121206/11353_1 /TAXON_ID=216820 /ORGANISM="Cyclophora tenuis, Strain ECT3854" /LENGTH=214 /DNA_ID=CAMNT_0004087121 /DNA_START=246 /DNA_END=890 /DNA_ORIENTATION=-
MAKGHLPTQRSIQQQQQQQQQQRKQPYHHSEQQQQQQGRHKPPQNYTQLLTQQFPGKAAQDLPRHHPEHNQDRRRTRRRSIGNNAASLATVADADADEKDELYLVERYGRALRRFRKLHGSIDEWGKNKATRETSALHLYDLAYDGPEVQLLQELAKEEEAAAAANNDEQRSPINSENTGLAEAEAAAKARLLESWDDWEHHIDELYRHDKESA